MTRIITEPANIKDMIEVYRYREKDKDFDINNYQVNPATAIVQRGKGEIPTHTLHCRINR